MKQIIVAVRDKKAESYGRPFVSPTAGMAIRSFSDECQRQAEDNPMYKHPSDFALYKIADYEDETAMVSALPSPELLIEADQV